MFRFVGRWVSRAWGLILAGWLILLLGAYLAAPAFKDVVKDQEFAFLPPDAPSRISDDIFQQAFPEDRSASNIVLVVHRRGLHGGTLDEDKKFIESVLKPGLMSIIDAEGGLAGPELPAIEAANADSKNPPAPPKPSSIVARIRTPSDLGTGVLLVSPDQEVMLVALELTTDFLANRNWATISKIETLVQKLKIEGQVPTGLTITMTGSAVIGRDHDWAQLRSARATELLTVVLVVGLLILIYRAPLLAMIPLATVVLAVQVAMNLLSILGGWGYLSLFQGVQIYITILAYGAGVDYCLFLTARYKEELDRGINPANAVARAIGAVGGTVTASAFTVIGGIGMMMFAQFGKFRQAGFAIPFTLFIVLLATLSFTPALLRLAGRWAFWPRRYQPGLGACPLEAVEASPMAAESFSPIGRAQRCWGKVARLMLLKPGLVWLTAVGVMLPFAAVGGVFYDRISYDLIGDLPAEAPSVAGTRMLQDHFPAGLIGPTKILLVNPNVDFSTAQGRNAISQVTARLQARQEELGLRDLRSLSAPLGLSPAAQNVLVDLGPNQGFRSRIVDRAAVNYYVANLAGIARSGTRFDLILNYGPFSHSSVRSLELVKAAIHDALPEGLRADTRLYFAGPTPSIQDLQALMRQDRLRIELLVMASVLLILVMLLRQVLLSVYLLVSVLFSYFATLGLSFIVFWLLDPNGFTGIDWKVAIFLFTILVAVGEDYNIFLMTRILEEERRYGAIEGIRVALCRTGPIISSCGIIMAGTFASLLAGSLSEMKQLGFALAFGILVDTFVVRPILVPTFLFLRHKLQAAPARRPFMLTGKAGPSAIRQNNVSPSDRLINRPQSPA